MSATRGEAAVTVQDLTVSLATGVPVIQDVSFSVAPGEILGVVGESGSGKTTLALALLGYTRAGVEFRGGTISVGEESIIGRDARSLQALRGRTVSYVPQDPGGSLNPSMRIGSSILDVLRAHRRNVASGPAVADALQRVELGGGDDFAQRYPHQLSGGQQQRVAITMATVCSPPVAVLDEPTTGLDVLTQDRILGELRRLRSDEGMAMVYVSHDLAVVSELADRILVMYAGRVLELGPARRILSRPRHPYTRALVESIPDVRAPRSLHGIAGVSVGVGEWPSGCSFADRCRHERVSCRERVPDLRPSDDEHLVRCLRWSELEPIALTPTPDLGPVGDAARREPVLVVSGLQARYRTRAEAPVVNDVSFSAAPGECVALVGESGSGKSTIARCIAGLHEPSAGIITFLGEPLEARARARPAEVRRRIQIVFQNPYSSLNPRQRVREALERPLRVLRGLPRGEAEREIAAVLERVRLPPHVADRFPGELSGGERQRVAIARALAAKPELLICDEITSALDVSVQAAVLELLAELRQEFGLTMLFITHNLGVVACVADSVLVLNRGELCESGSVTDVLRSPRADYTRELLRAAPSLSDHGGVDRYARSV